MQFKLTVTIPDSEIDNAVTQAKLKGFRKKDTSTPWTEQDKKDAITFNIQKSMRAFEFSLLGK